MVLLVTPSLRDASSIDMPDLDKSVSRSRPIARSSQTTGVRREDDLKAGIAELLGSGTKTEVATSDAAEAACREMAASRFIVSSTIASIIPGNQLQSQCQSPYQTGF